MSSPRCCTYTPNYNYNKSGYLKECLDSLAALTYKNLDIIIIDDGSTDGSQDLISKYALQDNRITFISKEHWVGSRRGQGWINEALRWADAHGCEFFSVADSDDILSPDYWETVLPYFTGPEIGIVRVGLWKLEEGRKPRLVRPKPITGPADLLVQNMINISSPFRMDVWREVGDWDENIAWNDWDFWTRAILRYGWKFSTCKEPAFSYRVHSSQMSKESHTKRFDELIGYMRTKYANDLANQNMKAGYGAWK